MAFSGLPSKACANCRIRRIKCNLDKPECAQCRRAGKECPGYRDQLALLFRDENEKVIRKACGQSSLLENQKRKSVKKQRQNSEKEGLRLDSSQTTASKSTSSTFDQQIRPQTYSLSMYTPLSVSRCIEDPGIIFFFRCYMTQASASSNGQPYILSSDIWRGVSQRGHFVDAVSCVGLAGLSNVNNDPGLMVIARQKYAMTLQRVIAALRAPERADIGYTVKAAMMLWMFEITSCDLQTKSFSDRHIDGIAALLSTEQFRKAKFEVGVRHKYKFLLAMLIKYARSGQKSPDSLAKWLRILERSLCRKDVPVASLAGIFVRFLDLNADIRKDMIVDASNILREAISIDDALEKWELTLPSEWKYKVEISSQILGTYEGQYHIYFDHWIAQMWIHYRCIRILVHGHILMQLISLPSVPPEFCEKISKSLGVISHVAFQLCTGISAQIYRISSGIICAPSQSQMGSTLMLLWPLEVAGSAIGVPETLHKWTLDGLEFLRQTTGVLQITEFALSAVAQRDYWKSIAAFDSSKEYNRA